MRWGQRLCISKSKQFKFLKFSYILILKPLNLTVKFLQVITTYEESHEGMQPDAVISESLYKLVNEPNHILYSSLSCIDIIFTNQPSLIINPRTNPSLHTNCHHQMTCKLNKNLKLQYPLTYQHLLWNFKILHLKQQNCY